MSWDAYLTFCVAATALALVPGPTIAVIIANSLRYGRRAGLLNVAGTQAGFLVWLAIAGLGLSAAVSLMGVWFDVLRWAGALYLIWLGIKLLRAKGQLSKLDDKPPPANGFFLQGFIVIISNPKMLVLFGAMIPPLLTPGGNATAETLWLGLTFMAIATVGDTLYALTASSAGSWLSGRRVRAIEIASGLCLTAGGIWLALRGR